MLVHGHWQIQILGKEPDGFPVQRCQIQQPELVVHGQGSFELLVIFFLERLGRQQEQEPGGFLVEDQAAEQGQAQGVHPLDVLKDEQQLSFL